jgi:hypothetical protein
VQKLERNCQQKKEICATATRISCVKIDVLSFKIGNDTYGTCVIRNYARFFQKQKKMLQIEILKV